MKGVWQRLKTIGMSITLLLLFSAGPVHSSDTCVTEACHSGLGKAEVVHSPVAEGECLDCHEPGDQEHPSKNPAADFRLAGVGKELCYICHESMEDEVVVHDPIKKGTCLSCHSPHQSKSQKLLKAETTSSLCFSCHKDDKTSKKNVHGPVESGDCNICHTPHTSKFPGLLEEEGSALCFSCHLDRKDQFELKYKHKPAENNCVNCHNPHSSDFEYMLILKDQDLCFSCHSEVKKKIDESLEKHGAQSLEDCTICHTPHASDYPRQLKDPAEKICFNCHKELKEKIESSTRFHGPIKQNDCYACHDPHGSHFIKILRKQYPEDFYVEYSQEIYEICFQCHNKDISDRKKTRTLTGFRNGSLNLHFVHVNQKKGRSCKTCHEVHASDQEKHIRETVRFSDRFVIKIKFIKTNTGGKCLFGCHKPQEYDRENPVKQ